MRLTLLAAFATGYVLGSKAGRERYDQIRDMARDASRRLDQSGLRDRLEGYGARLERYADHNGRSAPAR
ncbi:MAG TPA: hypothetical protein VMF87_15410 [Streptosporangiaceae bacterium]|nr:hypothetical protein [Streptosporangiaceae bacterium]